MWADRQYDKSCWDCGSRIEQEDKICKYCKSCQKCDNKALFVANNLRCFPCEKITSESDQTSFNNLGEIIKNARKNANLTQAELADILGVSKSTVKRWECQNTIPSTKTLLKIYEKMNISHESIPVRDTVSTQEPIKENTKIAKKSTQWSSGTFFFGVLFLILPIIYFFTGSADIHNIDREAEVLKSQNDKLKEQNRRLKESIELLRLDTERRIIVEEKKLVDNSNSLRTKNAKDQKKPIVELDKKVTKKEQLIVTKENVNIQRDNKLKKDGGSSVSTGTFFGIAFIVVILCFLFLTREGQEFITAMVGLVFGFVALGLFMYLVFSGIGYKDLSIWLYLKDKWMFIVGFIIASTTAAAANK